MYWMDWSPAGIHFGSNFILLMLQMYSISCYRLMIHSCTQLTLPELWLSSTCLLWSTSASEHSEKWNIWFSAQHLDQISFLDGFERRSVDTFHTQNCYNSKGHVCNWFSFLWQTSFTVKLKLQLCVLVFFYCGDDVYMSAKYSRIWMFFVPPPPLCSWRCLKYPPLPPNSLINRPSVPSCRLIH